MKRAGSFRWLRFGLLICLSLWMSACAASAPQVTTGPAATAPGTEVIAPPTAGNPTTKAQPLASPTLPPLEPTPAPASPSPFPSQTANPTATLGPAPTLGLGSIMLPGENGGQPVREYVCPWLDMPDGSPHYTYQILQTYPHDPTAYTEGLVYLDGFLYESTGIRGASSLRKVELETGKVLQQVDLAPNFFGEGIALLQGKIFQLTWQARLGFIYDLQTFEQLNTFTYQTEGWGMTHDGTNLIMSDGTNTLTYLDPQSLKVTRTVGVTTASVPVNKLNELEYIEGEVWANVYLTSCIARIDPQDGNVTGWLDVRGMLTKTEMQTSEVPNGIAYDPDTGRIFVTGKYWPKLFEIEVIPSAQ